MKTLAPALLVVPVAFLGSSTLPALAQANALGAIVSSVRDASGRPVVGALVNAIGPVTREASSNAAGIVTLSGLPAGTYTVRVTRAGFAPYGQLVKVGSQGDGVKVLSVLVAPENFASVGSEFGSTVSAPLSDHTSPYVAPQIINTLSANILASGSISADIASVAPTLEGASATETRVELDGIPLAGGATNASALRFRSALDLSTVALTEGPGLSTSSLQGAIAGIVDYQSAPISRTSASSYDLGYDSTFDSFGHARFSNTYGKVGVLLDAVDGDLGDASAVVKARVDLSHQTSIDVATYESRSSVVDGAETTTSDAPAYAGDVRTQIASGTLQGRIFESSSQDTALSGTVTDASDAWRTNGYAFDYALPFGENLATVGYDRRVERASFDDGPDALESTATLRLATDFAVTRLGRLELGDDLSSGTYLPHRDDPQIALAIRTGNSLNLRFAAGSAYATVPETLLAAATANAPFAPESSFGYRASADITTRAADHVRVAAFELRRYDAFAELSEARSRGVELGFHRQALPERLGVDADVDVVRTYAFGSLQPLARYEPADEEFAGEQIAGNPYSKARVALDYKIDDTELRFGTTLLGANNSLSPTSVVLGDCSLTIPVQPLGYVRMGVENMFGQTAFDPRIAPLFPPRELTLSLQR